MSPVRTALSAAKTPATMYVYTRFVFVSGVLRPAHAITNVIAHLSSIDAARP